MLDATKITDERLKLWLDFWKSIIIGGLVALAIAIIPVYINSQIQDRELATKAAEQKANIDIAKNKTEADIKSQIIAQEKQYVEAFLERATEVNVEKRYMFTQYLANLTRDPEFRRGWKSLAEAATEERRRAQEDLAKAQQDILKKSGDELQRAQENITRLQAELSSRPAIIEVAPSTLDINQILMKFPCPTGTISILATFSPNHLESNFLPNILFKFLGVRTDSTGDPLRNNVIKHLRNQYSSWPPKFASARDSNTIINLITARLCADDTNKIVDDTALFTSGGQPIKKLPAWDKKPPEKVE